MNTLKFAACAVASSACLTIASGAQAATTSFEFGLPIDQTIFFTALSGNLGLFDSNLGTLTGASLEIDFAATMDMTLSSSAFTPVITPVTLFITVTPRSSLGGLDNILTGLNMNSVQGTGDGFFLPFQSVTIGPFSGTSSKTIDLGSILGELTAAGGGSFSISSSSAYNFVAPGAAPNTLRPTSANSTAGLGARITYAFDPVAAPVPEPASALMALVGLALVGGVATVRRRQA